MPNGSNQGDVFVWTYAGDPTGIPTGIINPPRGALVINPSSGQWYRKGTGYGDNSSFTALSLAETYLVPSGLIGNGSSDDSAAINAALATGNSVLLPYPSSSYRVSHPILFSSVIGQKLIGVGQNVHVVADAGVAKIIATRNRSQQIENLHISGAGIVSGQSGVYIGPSYNPYWKCTSLLIDGCGIGIENKCPSSNPSAFGSDAGGILNCQLETCDIGHLAFGNQDDTPIIGTSFSGCVTAGVKVDGGGACIIGGVMGGCGTSLIVAAGNASARNVHFEPDDSTSGYSGFVVDVAVNSICSIIDCATQKGAALGVVDVRGAANSFIDLYGAWIGANSARANGTALIRQWGGIQGNIIVDYNGAANLAFRAGPYDYVDTSLPTAAAVYVGRAMMLLNPTAKELHWCSQTGASSYTWT